MIHKTMVASAKAVDEAEGIVEAYTNTMGVVDADGDIVEATAFNASIADNLPIPVLSGHDQGKLVGKVIFAQPRHITGDEYRLFTRMQYNMETEAGRDAFSNVAGDYIREWSIGFNIPKESDVEQEGSDVSTVIRRIANLDWVEVSSVIRGSSPSTVTVAAKALPVTDAEKGAIPSHLTAWVEDSWDGGLMRGRIKGGAATVEAGPRTSELSRPPWRISTPAGRRYRRTTGAGFTITSLDISARRAAGPPSYGLPTLPTTPSHSLISTPVGYVSRTSSTGSAPQTRPSTTSRLWCCMAVR
jgi:HK97 family phage prohead protease